MNPPFSVKRIHRYFVSTSVSKRRGGRVIMPQNTLNYTKCAVIVHGKSEFTLVKYTYTNLHLPVKIISKDKGRGSIQINGLMDFLNKK